MSTNPDTPPMDLDDLLGSDPTVDKVVAPEPAVDPLAARKAALEAELAKPSPIAGKDASELTPEEQEIRDLEDRVARKKSADLDAAEDQYEKVEGDSILIHFVADGFSFAGQVWLRGQECEFALDGKAFANTKDRTGKSWLDLRHDPDAQIARYGQHYFSDGPWRGPNRFNTTGLANPDDVRAVEALAAREAARNRAVPVL